MRYKALLGCAAVLVLASCSKGADAPADSYIQAHTTQQLMANVMEPTAEIYWKSSGYVVDETGEHDLTPTTEEGWLATRTSAATITEMGNLLMTPLYAEGRGDDWIEFSRALVEVGKQAEQTAIDRDSEAIMEVGGTMYNICSACHQVYPPQNAPEAEEAESEAGE